MRPLALALALALSALLTLACAHDPPAEGWKVTKDGGAARVPRNEEALLADALKEHFKGKPAGFVLREESIPVMKKKSLSFPQDLKTMAIVLPGITQPVLDAFIKANKQGFLYKEVPPATMAQALRLEALMRGQEDGFAAFRKAFPKAQALVTAARPGVEPQRRAALLYFTATTGDLAGSGYLALLKRDGERWKIAKKAVLWSAGGEMPAQK